MNPMLVQLGATLLPQLVGAFRGGKLDGVFSGLLKRVGVGDNDHAQVLGQAKELLSTIDGEVKPEVAVVNAVAVLASFAPSDPDAAAHYHTALLKLAEALRDIREVVK